MRKSVLCICKNKGTDIHQLHGNHTADLHLYFRFIVCTILLLPKSEISSLKLSSVAVLPINVGPFRKPQRDKFSCSEAQIQ